MIVELTAIGTLTVSVIGSAWKLHNHFDSRLDRMETERGVIQAQLQLCEYRITQLESLMQREQV